MNCSLLLQLVLSLMKFLAKVASQSCFFATFSKTNKTEGSSSLKKKSDRQRRVRRNKIEKLMKSYVLKNRLKTLNRVDSLGLGD